MTTVNAYAAMEAGGTFRPFEYELPEIGPEQVDIAVESCGICHSDWSMLDNDWEMTEYPFVGGHEVIGSVAAFGKQVPGLQIGDRVGLGWFCKSCLHCDQCIGGNQNL
ncbi:MAG: alcohol dehydrogenase catalytic domain-containing protein, partial [Pirellulaceae bacterium]